MRFSISKFLDDSGFKYRSNGAGTHYVLEECPSCKKSGKFYINAQSGQFVCHRCAADHETGMKGGVVALVSLLGNLSKDAAYKMVYNHKKTETETITAHSPRPFYRKENEFKNDKESAEPIRIPSVFRKIKSTDEAAWNYLLNNRGLSEADIERSGVLISGISDRRALYTELLKFYGDDEAGKKDAYFYSGFTGRVIFPARKNDRIFGMVARDYTGKQEKKYKVLNSKGSFRGEVVWNLDRAKLSPVLVICEGIIDAIKCGLHRSVATFGVIITTGQILELFRLSANTEVIIVADPGFEKESRENARLLSNHFVNIKVLEFKDLPIQDPRSGRDAGDRSHQEMEFLIEAIKKEQPFDLRSLPKQAVRKTETKKWVKKPSNRNYGKKQY